MESVMKKTAATSLLASCAVSLALFSAHPINLGD